MSFLRKILDYLAIRWPVRHLERSEIARIEYNHAEDFRYWFGESLAFGHSPAHWTVYVRISSGQIFHLNLLESKYPKVGDAIDVVVLTDKISGKDYQIELPGQ